MIVLVLLAGGCRRDEPAPTTTTGPGAPGATAPATSKAPAGTSISAVPARGADADDDLEAPRALPRTMDLQKWVKTQPVRVAAPEDLNRLIEDERQRGILAAFPLKRVASCAYQMGDTTAEVLYVEAAAPEDAFGVFSLLTTKPGTRRRDDNSVRAADVLVDRMILSAWQGCVCLRVAFGPVRGEQTQQECERLFDRILFSVPAADPPLLMRLVPADKQQGARLWQARTTAALRYAENDTLRRLDPAVMDARLGLQGDAILSVAAVPVAGEDRPNVIWLVQYPDAESARAAHDRYHAAVESPEDPVDGNAHPGSAKGRFFIGSWTADQESIQGLLPLLETALPE